MLAQATEKENHISCPLFQLEKQNTSDKTIQGNQLSDDDKILHESLQLLVTKSFASLFCRILTNFVSILLTQLVKIMKNCKNVGNISPQKSNKSCCCTQYTRYRRVSNHKAQVARCNFFGSVFDELKRSVN